MSRNSAFYYNDPTPDGCIWTILVLWVFGLIGAVTFWILVIYGLFLVVKYLATLV